MTFALPSPIQLTMVKMRPMQTLHNALSDAELVSRFAWQDEAALSEIYDRYVNALFGLAFRVCNSRGRAEEIVQDTLMKLWRNPKLFDPNKAALSTFLLTLTRNASIDALRRERLTTPLEDESGEPLPIASTLTTPLEHAELTQLSTQVRQAMMELSDAHRQTVELAYFKGASREEIAQVMSVPVGTVKSRLKYALDKLRTHLEKFSNALGES